MQLRFTVSTGITGFVTEDLDVAYDGEWRPYIERLIDDICRDRDPTSEEKPEERVFEVFQELVTVLPHRFPIPEVELVED